MPTQVNVPEYKCHPRDGSLVSTEAFYEIIGDGGRKFSALSQDMLHISEVDLCWG